MSANRVALAVSFLLCFLAARPQTGPGGVGNATNNILWLSGDQGVVAPMAGVIQWRDRSGNNNHAAQAVSDLQPVLAPNAFNGYPAVLFDNDQVNPDRLTIPDNSTLEGMNGLSGFVIFRLNPGTPNSAPRGFLSKRVNPGSQNAYGWFLWQNGGNLSQHLDIDGSNERAASSNNFGTGINYLNSFIYHGANPSNANDQLLFTNNAQVGNRQETSTSIPNYSSDLHIGSLYGHTGTGSNTTRFNGLMAEVILYRQTLTTVQHLIVNNYLAAKYGLALGSGDLYTMDDPANGNYDHDVAGIGRSGSDVVDGSRGSGLVTMKRSSGNLANNAYLFWGHDNGALGAWGVADMHPSLQGRLERVWRVSEVTAGGAAADVGNVDITFDLSELGPVVASDLRLVVDLNNDGSFANDVPISGATDLGNGSFRFSNITAIANSRRFTLGTVNLQTTPLPVELVAFHAWEMDRSVLLEWSTASEYNSERFDVLRSADAEQWTLVGSLPAAQFSQTLLEYSHVDPAPLSGTSFYRLVQVDLDGSMYPSPIVPVTLMPQKDMLVHPVPFLDSFVLSGRDLDLIKVTLVDMQGREIPCAWQGSGGGVQVDTASLPNGTYLLRAHTSAGILQQRVLKAP